MLPCKWCLSSSASPEPVTGQICEIVGICADSQQLGSADDWHPAGCDLFACAFSYCVADKRHVLTAGWGAQGEIATLIAGPFALWGLWVVDDSPFFFSRCCAVQTANARIGGLLGFFGSGAGCPDNLHRWTLGLHAPLALANRLNFCPR